MSDLVSDPVGPDVLAFAEVVAPGVDPADLRAVLSAYRADGVASPFGLDGVGSGPASATAVQARLDDPATTQATRSAIRAVQQAHYGNPRRLPGEEVASWVAMGYHEDHPDEEWPDLSDAAPAVTPWSAVRASYDVVVVGSGTGAVVAQVAADAGARVLLVERGDWLPRPTEPDHLRNQRVSSGLTTQAGPRRDGNPRVAVGPDGDQTVSPVDGAWSNNAMTLGGGLRVYGAQAWRFAEQDFAMASTYGIPDGSSLADWPIGHADLEPYYQRAERELGVSGDPTGNAYAGTRGSGYPMAPMPLTGSGEVLAAGARRLGWSTGPVPLLINSRPFDGRAACRRCGTCVGFSCRADAKNGTHNTVLPRALATRRCDLVTSTMATRLVTDTHGRVSGVALTQVDDAGRPGPSRVVGADRVVVAGGAIESARLLLLSAHGREPDGLGNAHDQVGRHLQGHVYAGAIGLVDEPVQFGEGPGPSISTNDFRHGNAGIVGGGMLANDFVPIPLAALLQLSGAGLLEPWGAASVEGLAHRYRRHLMVMGPIQEIPMPGSRVQLDPSVTDALGLPVARLSGDVHPESVRAAGHHADRAVEWLTASGAHEVVALRGRSGGPSGGQHQAGTTRMGDDPSRSVVDPDGRVWGHENVWVADTGVHVTNGGVNPVLTALALAHRVGNRVIGGR